MTDSAQRESRFTRLAIWERGDIWHAVDGPSDADATFRPILCGRESGEGIVLPGNAYRREVTCPRCRAAGETP